NDGPIVTQLRYPNSQLTIIIPQGQFKEFLALRGKDRSEIMKDNFNLTPSDLGPKESVLQLQNNSKLEQLNGAHSGFDTVSNEILENIHRELNDAQRHLTVVKEETATLEKEVSRLLESKKTREELAGKKAELKEHLLEQPRIAQLEKELHTYEATGMA